MTTALVLIDVQNDYFEGGAMVVPGSEAAAAKAALVLKRFRAAGRPIIHVRHEMYRPGAAFLLPGTPGAEIHPLVSPGEGEPVITKNFPNSFRGTALLDRLREQDVGTIVVAGMMTQMCIDATTRAGFDLGLAVTLVHDACAARPLAFGGVSVTAAQVHAAFVAALGAVYARVAAADEVESLV